MMGCGCLLLHRQVFSVLEGSAMNACFRVLKETKWILSFKAVDYILLSISQTTFRHCCVRFYSFGQPLLKQLYIILAKPKSRAPQLPFNSISAYGFCINLTLQIPHPFWTGLETKFWEHS